MSLFSRSSCSSNRSPKRNGLKVSASQAWIGSFDWGESKTRCYSMQSLGNLPSPRSPLVFRLHLTHHSNQVTVTMIPPSNSSRSLSKGTMGLKFMNKVVPQVIKQELASPASPALAYSSSTPVKLSAISLNKNAIQWVLPQALNFFTEENLMLT